MKAIDRIRIKRDRRAFWAAAREWAPIGALCAALPVLGYAALTTYSTRAEASQRPSYALALLVNRPDGSQVETVIASGLSFAECDPMQRAIWKANEAAPIVGNDELGPIPAFDAACLSEES